MGLDDFDDACRLPARISSVTSLGRPPPQAGTSASSPMALNSWIRARTQSAVASRAFAISGAGHPSSAHVHHLRPSAGHRGGEPRSAPAQGPQPHPLLVPQPLHEHLRPDEPSTSSEYLRTALPRMMRDSSKNYKDVVVARASFVADALVAGRKAFSVAGCYSAPTATISTAGIA